MVDCGGGLVDVVFECWVVVQQGFWWLGMMQVVGQFVDVFVVGGDGGQYWDVEFFGECWNIDGDIVCCCFVMYVQCQYYWYVEFGEQCCQGQCVVQIFGIVDLDQIVC